MNDIELFGKFSEECKELDGEINAELPKDFIKQFRNLFSLPDARKYSGVVYVWYTHDGIPRMKGKSNIVYIGKTKNTLFDRHHRYAELEGSGINIARYAHIIHNYGPIKVKFIGATNPKETEKEFLECYFNAHLETPPMNRQS
jgi:hypothetical protein